LRIGNIMSLKSLKLVISTASFFIRL
jgi:hypothetical protein